jgi:hypothetical protein
MDTDNGLCSRALITKSYHKVQLPAGHSDNLPLPECPLEHELLGARAPQLLEPSPTYGRHLSCWPQGWHLLLQVSAHPLAGRGEGRAGWTTPMAGAPVLPRLEYVGAWDLLAQVDSEAAWSALDSQC